jgi:beta-phosphoglucomutase-like phosphatase (HAD superfamily)
LLSAGMQSPAAVIFDCDGVLVDSEVLAIEVEVQLLAEAGLVYEPEEYNHRFLGLSAAAAHELIDIDALARLGRPMPEDLADRIRDACWSACQARLTEVYGCAAAVSALSLPRAVASSSGADFLREKLRLTGLLAAFDPHAYSADLVARAKPHPDIFLHAAERLDVDPARCLAIEDSVNGVRAALAAGMTVWGFAGGGHVDARGAARLVEAGAHQVVETWADAMERFAGF